MAFSFQLKVLSTGTGIGRNEVTRCQGDKVGKGNGKGKGRGKGRGKGKGKGGEG